MLPNRGRVSNQKNSVRLEIQLRKQDSIKWVNLEANKSSSEQKPSGECTWYTLTSEPAATAVRSVVNSPKRCEASRGANASAKANGNGNSKAVGKKPFCLVSPNNAQTTTYAGYTGIENFKNSCFMNAVLQVLANTRSVRDFAAQFDVENEGERVTKRPRTETKVERGATANERKLARGELVRELCAMINDLWTGTVAHVTPIRFKALFCTRFAQFAGNLQQDSHEFLTFLLDGLRDELSGKAEVAVDGELAAEPSDSLAFLHSFLGELRSEICCLECEHVSTRRDAFFCLSVPIPKPAARVRVLFMSYEPSEQPQTLDIELPASSDDRAPCALNVLRQVATRMHCRVPDLRMYEVHQGRFHRLFTPHSALDELASGDQLVVQQVAPPDTEDDSQYLELFVTQRVLLPNAQLDVCSNCQRSCADVQTVMKRCTRCYRVAYCSRDCQLVHYDEHASWCRYMPALVGCPFILSIPRSRASFRNICDRMEQYARCSVQVSHRSASTATLTETVDCLNSNDSHAHVPQLSSPPVDDKNDIADSSSHARPAFMFMVKEANEHGLETGRTLVFDDAQSDSPMELDGWKYVYMDWLNKDRDRPYVLVQSKPLDGADAGNGGHLECASSIKTSASVYDCLSSFTECEMLHAAEAWRCPRCDHLQAASKQLTISRPPDILVVHLKRFKPNREKLDVLVDFPVLSLDIGKFVVRDGEHDVHVGSEPSEFVYDLYATVNHFGVTTGGHYTAYARLVDCSDSTKSEFGWREFDDLNVKTLHDVNMVRSRHAYLLFYKRRALPTSNAAD